MISFYLKCSNVCCRPISSALSRWMRYPVMRLLTFMKALTPSTQDLARKLTTIMTQNIKRWLSQLFQTAPLIVLYSRDLKLVLLQASIQTARETKWFFLVKKVSSDFFLVLEKVEKSQLHLTFYQLPQSMKEIVLQICESLCQTVSRSPTHCVLNVKLFI